LMPYKEHLQNLISEKTLRDELSGWSLRTEITDVLPQHRPLLIPHIIDILFPKLMHKGRSSTHVRPQPAILRLEQLTSYTLNRIIVRQFLLSSVVSNPKNWDISLIHYCFHLVAFCRVLMSKRMLCNQNPFQFAQAGKHKSNF